MQLHAYFSALKYKVDSHSKWLLYFCKGALSTDCMRQSAGRSPGNNNEFVILLFPTCKLSITGRLGGLSTRLEYYTSLKKGCLICGNHSLQLVRRAWRGSTSPVHFPVLQLVRCQVIENPEIDLIKIAGTQWLVLHQILAGDVTQFMLGSTILN